MKELKDTQNERDDRNLAIDRVGVKGLRFPVEVRDKNGSAQRTVATVALAVDLPHHYKGTHMSRFVEVLNRLETEVFGSPRILIPSRALLRVADPLELGARFPDYRTARKPAVASSTQELEGRLRQLMEEMSRLGQPIDA